MDVSTLIYQRNMVVPVPSQNNVICRGFYFLSELWWEVVVHFVDTGGIVDHQQRRSYINTNTHVRTHNFNKQLLTFHFKFLLWDKLNKSFKYSFIIRFWYYFNLQKILRQSGPPREILQGRTRLLWVSEDGLRLLSNLRIWGPIKPLVNFHKCFISCAADSPDNISK